MLLPLGLLLLLWLWAFAAEGAFHGGPNGKSFEADFAMFDAAAKITEGGGNPYDRAQLYRVEKHFLDEEHLPILKNRAVLRVGNPPLFFWLLRPLSGLSFQAAAWLWGLAMYFLLAAGFLALLAHLGWNRKTLPLLMFLAMPQVMLAAFYGNPVPIVFAALSLALVVSDRSPIFAGTLLTATWLKPQLALPLVIVVLIFQVRERAHATVAFAAGSIVLALCDLLAVGPGSIGHWLGALGAYSRDIATSPDVSSLTGLYARVAGSNVRTGLAVLTYAAALGVTAAVWIKLRRGKRSLPAISSLWLIWFLAAPYAHFYDEVLLTFPLLVLVGRDARQLGTARSFVAVYSLFFSLAVFQTTVGGAQPLCLFLLPVLWAIADADKSSQGNDDSSGESIALISGVRTA